MTVIVNRVLLFALTTALTGFLTVTYAVRSADPYDLERFVQTSDNKIKSLWKPPASKTSCRMAFKVHILRSGRLKGATIDWSNCNTEQESVALQAIKRASPFRPLPKQYPHAWITLEYTFNVYKYRKNPEKQTAQKPNDTGTDYYKQTSHYPLVHRGGLVYYYIDDPYGQSFWDEYDLPDRIRKEILPGSFEAWERASGGCVNVARTSNPQQAQIRVKWTNNYDDQPYLGYTQHNSALPYITIHMAIKRHDKHFNISEIRHIALHEAGHALGILGHSQDSSDVMYPTANYEVQSLTNRDINTIRRIYCK